MFSETKEEKVTILFWTPDMLSDDWLALSPPTSLKTNVAVFCALLFFDTAVTSWKFPVHFFINMKIPLFQCES